VRIRTHLLEPSTKSLCRPMGCCSSQPTDDRPGVPTREVTPPEQASPLTTQSVGTTRPAPQETRSGSETPQPGRMSPHERPARDNKRERVQSAPKRVQTKMDDENVPPLPSQRSRTKSYAPSSSKGSSLSVSAGEHDDGWSAYLLVTNNIKNIQGPRLDDRP